MNTPQLVAAVPPASDGKQLIRRLMEEGVNQGQFAIVDELLSGTSSPSFVNRGGAAGMKHLLAVYREAVPDANWHIEGQVAEGDLVVTYFVARGTHWGPLWGLPATGKQMAVTGILFTRCREQRIVEQRLHLDLLSLLQQLGLMPELGLEQAVLVARVLQASRFWASDQRGEEDS